MRSIGCFAGHPMKASNGVNEVALLILVLYAKAAMSMYHRYRMYSSMMMYQSHGMGYGGYGGGYGYGHNTYGYGSSGQRGMLLADEYDCIGSCPMNAFCDYGICRCRTGYVTITRYLQSND